MRSTQIQRFRNSRLRKYVTDLSSGDDYILAPVLDAYRSIGVHHGQITAVEVTTFESLLSGLAISEILEDPREESSDRTAKEGSGCAYLSHHEVSTNNDFPDSFSVLRDILEVLTFCLVNDAYAISGCVAKSLSSHALRTFFQRK